MRIKSIEGLRGCAALIVLISHLIVMYYPAAYWEAAEKVDLTAYIWYNVIIQYRR